MAICVALSPRSAKAQQPTNIVRVPFVGCKSDGQTGRLTAPRGESNVVAVAPEAARQLAFYKAEYGLGVLAPTGWYCFGTYGSNGSSLFVSPDPIDATKLLSRDWAGFAGAAIQLSVSNGDTSGRFSVARVIARVFPKHSQFVQHVVAEGTVPANSFPSGPYQTDKLVYRSSEVVEFETPAGAEGLGTESRLQKSSAPIRGVAILVGEPPDLVQLSLRLTPKRYDLGPAIMQQVEGDAKRLE